MPLNFLVYPHPAPLPPPLTQTASTVVHVPVRGWCASVSLFSYWYLYYNYSMQGSGSEVRCHDLHCLEPSAQTASTVVHVPGAVLPRPYSVIGTCSIIMQGSGSEVRCHDLHCLEPSAWTLHSTLCKFEQVLVHKMPVNIIILSLTLLSFVFNSLSALSLCACILLWTTTKRLRCRCCSQSVACTALHLVARFPR